MSAFQPYTRQVTKKASQDYANNYFKFAKFRANQEIQSKKAETTIPGIGSASAKKGLDPHKNSSI